MYMLWFLLLVQTLFSSKTLTNYTLPYPKTKGKKNFE